MLAIMTKTRRVAAHIAWAVLAALLATAMILWLANRHDRPVSAQAQALALTLSGQPPVAHQANAYLYVAGMDAETGMDPVQEALARKERELAYLAANPAAELAPRQGEPRQRSPNATELHQLCKEVDLTCAQALSNQPARTAAWLSSEQWLLDRYRALLSMPSWREPPMRNHRESFPQFHVALDGQRLFLVELLQLGRNTDPASVRTMLDKDMRFWRRALAGSNMLISKMIAVAAIERNLLSGNVVLSQLPIVRQADAIPASWHAPLTAAERSMLPSFAWEVGLSTLLIRAQLDAMQANYIPSHVLRALFQQQDTSGL